MNKRILILALLLLSFAITVSAEDEKEEKDSGFNSEYYIGGVIGAWISSGDDIPDLYTDPDDSTFQVKADVNTGSAYLGLVAGKRLFPSSYIEFAFGMTNRGTIRVREGSSEDIGNLLVYHFLVLYKLYPLSISNLRLQPYIGAGGGLYYGRNSIQFTNNYYHSLGYGTESETDFNLVLNGGFEYRLSNSLHMIMDAKYMPTSFSDNLINASDYSAISIGVGLTYRH